MKYELGQKLEIHSLPNIAELPSLNGSIVFVKSLPGTHAVFTGAYGVLTKEGKIEWVAERYLRPYPPELPNGRGDTDNKSTWEEFRKATNLSTEQMDRIRGLNSNPDY
jgi:hypothetical protein